MTEPLAARFRALVLDAVRPYAGLPIMLSGGVDSATLLAASLALGARPDIYTFRLGIIETSDTRVARSMAQHFDLRFTLCEIPRTPEQLLADIRRTYTLIGTTTKTHVQCAQPWLYLAPAARADGHTAALMGMSADDAWGNIKRVLMYWRTRGEEWARAERRRRLDNPNASDVSVARLSAALGVELHDPYRAPDLEAFLLDRTRAEMHSPQQKALALHAFPEFWRSGAWYRESHNLQVISGIRTWHDTLLASPHNTMGARTVVPIYRALVGAS